MNPNEIILHRSTTRTYTTLLGCPHVVVTWRFGLAKYMLTEKFTIKERIALWYLLALHV